MIRSKARALALFLAGSIAAGSGMGGCEGGTSSETVGIVVAIPGNNGVSGRTDAGNSVSLYAAEFLPQLDSGFSKTVTAGPDGEFDFADLEAGRYQLLARRPSDGKAALIADLVVPPGMGGSRRVPLEPTGTLSGSITDDSAAFLGLVYAPGTPFFGSGDSLMRYSIEGLPPGNYRVMKTWKRASPCDSGKVCGGIETRRDSTGVEILPGMDAIW